MEPIFPLYFFFPAEARIILSTVRENLMPPAYIGPGYPLEPY